MSDYIERDSAVFALEKALYSYEDETEAKFKDDPELDLAEWFFQRILVQVINGHDRQAILDLPAADVRTVVKAEWYGEGDGYADGELVYDMWSCPICGKRFEEWEEKPDWNFCPNCGADMREVLGDE